jgi:hypothetical protein
LLAACRDEQHRRESEPVDEVVQYACAAHAW